MPRKFRGGPYFDLYAHSPDSPSSRYLDRFRAILADSVRWKGLLATQLAVGRASIRDGHTRTHRLVSRWFLGRIVDECRYSAGRVSQVT